VKFFFFAPCGRKTFLLYVLAYVNCKCIIAIIVPLAHYAIPNCKLTYSSHLILFCVVLLPSLRQVSGQFQFVWCNGGSIVTITPPDLSYSCFSYSFCNICC